MRSPEHKIAQPRAGKQFEDELQLRYIAPGAFTVLPPDDNPPDPPPAPEPYRLTPSTRRQKNKAFAIIGEVDSSRANSRSPSPTGRISPFRGRGFNPSGSRFASPSPTPPPPEDARLTPTNLSPQHVSRIPKLKRKGSSAAFGDKVFHYDSSPTKRKLESKLSQSLTNLEPKRNTNRPPPSPRKNVQSKTPAFQKLSPIAGSSPEPSQSLSSPSRIPKSRSTPPSRRSSPTRTPSSVAHKPQSRNTSREASPTKDPTSPTRIPVKYKNVQAKVNSYVKPKPKVPPKPQVLSEQSEESDVVKDTKTKPSLNRKESVNRLRTNSRLNLIQKTDNKSNNINNNVTGDSVVNRASNKNSTKTNNNSSNTINKSSNNSTSKVGKENGEENKVLQSPKKEDRRPSPKKDEPKLQGLNENGKRSRNSSPAKGNTRNNYKNTDITSDTDTSYDIKETADSNGEGKQIKRTESCVKLADILPSTTTVVSSTTTTVTQPLKIDATVNAIPKPERSKQVSPIVDGRVLSATSVSNAMNRMNDTVLNTQTVIKDHGFSRLSPAANAVISMASETALDTKNATTALPIVEPLSHKPEHKVITQIKINDRGNNHTNHLTHAGIISAKALEMEVQKNMNRLISPEHLSGNSIQKSVNDRIIEARTVVAADVKPIRITVKEKPTDVEVQSGNIRPPVSVSNGLNERPSLPPDQASPPNEPEKETPPKNACSRFFSNCKSKMSCKCCKKESSPEIQDKVPVEPKGCFGCLKKKSQSPVVINIEDETGKKTKLWDKLKCCNKHKVTDTSCFPKGKRKDSWVERRDSILGSQQEQPTRSKCSKDCCKDFLKTIFCINLCCKGKASEDSISRKASINSKKKSLTPTSVPPPENTRSKIDISLVEQTSHMRGAIPALPICLAWFCLVMNCIAPGTGTFFSGLFCLCIGKPRFSQRDGAKQRFGSFIINTFIGFGQFFTVLFCLVGWGWSIWWGVIMVKTAKKYKKLKLLETMEEENSRPTPAVNQNHHSRDPVRNA
ncbi:protein stum [Anoplophora glabripennis]|uniref:protein stum n=1 Tax=Anoplophora glabripennis TaxID=217634 RepID=UPI0008743801|nr:protein stum [Anoplophora glabripennis]